MLILVLLLAAGTGAFSQDKKAAFPRDEARIGYGLLTGPEFFNALFATWPAIGIKIAQDTITDYTASMYGVATLEYDRYLAKWISIGGSFSVNPITTLIKTKNGVNLTWNYYLFNVMPKVSFYYLNTEIISLYSGIEAGASFVFWYDRQGSVTKTDLGVVPAFHVNVFGIRMGKQIGGFMEWGYGYRGVVNFGVSARF